MKTQKGGFTKWTLSLGTNAHQTLPTTKAAEAYLLLISTTFLHGMLKTDYVGGTVETGSEPPGPCLAS